MRAGEAVHKAIVATCVTATALMTGSLFYSLGQVGRVAQSCEENPKRASGIFVVMNFGD